MKRISFDYELAGQARQYLQQLGLHDESRLENLSRQVTWKFGSLQALRKAVAGWVEDTCYLKLPRDEAGLSMAEAAILLSDIAARDPERFLSRTARPARALVDELRLSLPSAVPHEQQSAMPTQSLEPASVSDWLDRPFRTARPATANN